jgi:TatA/E family protein of Tat protein translocase
MLLLQGVHNLLPGFIGGIGTTELIVILVVVLLLFGPKKLPGLARSMGKALGSVRSAADEIRKEVLDEDRNPYARRPKPTSPPATPPSLPVGPDGRTDEEKGTGQDRFDG